MKKNPSTPPECPVGVNSCAALDQIDRLRLEMADLKELVGTDPLTGLPNYRQFRQALDQEMERTRRSQKPTSLVMLDIDHFKTVNDTHGHEIGNRALLHLAGLMREALRRIDIPCRYGGEEFAIILADTDLPTAIRVADRLRRKIAESPLVLDEGQTLSLTASLGVDEYSHRSERSAEQLIHAADQSLYRAKEEGRNCVRHAPLPELDTTATVTTDERAGLMGLFGKKDDKSS